MTKSDFLVFSSKVRGLALLLPARALLQRFSNLSVHQKHVENLMKQIDGPHLQRSGLFPLSGWGLRICISRGQGHANAAENFAITLGSSRLSLTPAACLPRINDTSGGW